MVHFEFKDLVLRGGEAKVSYKAQAAHIVRTVAPPDQQGQPKRGFSADDMDEAEALATKIEAGNGSVELTSAEAMSLVAKVEQAVWPISDPAFIQFVRDVQALKNQ